MLSGIGISISISISISSGIYDYLQLNLLKKYKVLYRYDINNDHINNDHIIAFMRQRQSAEKLMVDLAPML